MSVNTNFDATFCGKLAIHKTNSIQDYGYLIVLDINSLNIIQASENISELYSNPVEELIGLHFSNCIPEHAFDALKAEFDKGIRNRVPFKSSFVTKATPVPVTLLCHIKEDMVILEIEKDDEVPERVFSEVFQEVRSFIASIENTKSLQEVCEASIHEIRRIAGFDGIRMYRFDEHWNGEVIAEEIEGTLESYLGQTFPASDVPKQARDLYVKNPFRLIPNKDYITHRLYPVINPIAGGFIDLSDCNLRSVAAVHLEYMANMHVAASMSIRVMVEGKLWGLISCHHITPNYLSLENRSIFEWLSIEISYRIAAIIKQEALIESGRLSDIKADIIQCIFSKGDMAKGLMEDEGKQFLSLLDLDGFSVSINGDIVSHGIVPEQDEIENMLLWANSKSLGTVFSSHEFGEVYDDARHYQNIASGVVIIPINSHKGDFVIGFRPERIKDISWGGNPNEAVNFEKDGIKYHPRNSFKLWQQTIFGQSKVWTEAELAIAESFKNFLYQFDADQTFN
ncbi:GAF domain-containing protein [Pedobacter sp. MC2016-15]|uniref:GAF domain-containing protein n=1 Tax=Pedobacter sp. MC2016-15 TaxID=2994473 RepID=UPI00224688A4|nr:GAF domain-containing protein [Pedobacter sp. MC2016-15]MCX2480638.1 GAF domain-containing protein [Pedobacter sp. MC2016-15]